MATLKLLASCGQSANTMAAFYQRPVSAEHADVQAIAQFFEQMGSGTLTQPSVIVSIEDNAVPASGTFTFASIVATNTMTINGVVFTCVASGATGNQFNVGASDTAAAANAAAAINASVTTLIAGYVTATSALGVVTVTSVSRGKAGNQVTIVGGSNVTASGARLTGGAVDPGTVTYTF